ncbi:MAG: hypothetical protein MI810_01825 [Flavobacteriales bacterium]|nr:hypothetical protein [Flavobacteriales bacterium]
MIMKKWETYNPDWLVKIAREQIPDRMEIIQALAQCTKAKTESRAYVYFVNPNHPNEADSEWQFKENIMLEDKKYGTIVLDVLKDDKIGGVEFLKYVK